MRRVSKSTFGLTHMSRSIVSSHKRTEKKVYMGHISWTSIHTSTTIPQRSIPHAHPCSCLQNDNDTAHDIPTSPKKNNNKQNNYSKTINEINATCSLQRPTQSCWNEWHSGKAGQGGAMDQMMPSTEQGLTLPGELRPYRPLVGFLPRPPPSCRWSSTIRLSRRWLLNIGPQVDGLGSRLGVHPSHGHPHHSKKAKTVLDTPVGQEQERSRVRWRGAGQ